MSMNRDIVIQRFLELVREYPLLYDKMDPEYKDTEAKMNRWTIIGQEFSLTGPQAAAKFKNIRDRWKKIVLKTERNKKSGAGGDAGKIKTNWVHFDIIDGMLKTTPHYAERTSTNVPIEERLSQESSTSSAGYSGLGQMNRCPDIPLHVAPEEEDAPFSSPSTYEAGSRPEVSVNRSASSQGSIKRPAGAVPPSRRKQQKSNFEDCRYRGPGVLQHNFRKNCTEE
ncbi:uncharacterized protein LOC125943910 isoform X3 [Dermacentor silvarum]|uniref:uncharacterized protein LOC125943910 isoform X3 n=1 Tax=Dermacentor silvarum TaxID=543639 RepID=UPI002100FE56|nr:uncharacterized protein LOC125943910 isoform X3 [Dermacentor silvarum]